MVPRPKSPGPSPAPGRPTPASASRAAPTPPAEPGLAADDEGDALHEALDRFVAKTNAEVHGLFQILGSKRRLVLVNFLAGLSRGVGFFLGMTLVGGLVIGATALAIDFTARTLGWKDITFRSLMEVFARKAAEARAVWEDVAEEEGAPRDHAVAEPAGSRPARQESAPAEGPVEAGEGARDEVPPKPPDKPPRQGDDGG